jgi:DNA-directed RNA polymerase I subunit RPA2
MIESMAGKSASLHGTCYDATPFTYTEDTPPIDYMGKTLSAGKKSFFSYIDKKKITKIHVSIYQGY